MKEKKAEQSHRREKRDREIEIEWLEICVERAGLYVIEQKVKFFSLHCTECVQL